MASTGKMHCQTCDQRVTARLNMSMTKVLSSVRYTGHTGVKNGKKVSCPSKTVRYGEAGFPSWAKSALSGLPER